MSLSIRNKFDLETPCLILELDLLKKNLEKAQSIARQKGKQLRPHAKTHKCTTLAKKQIEYGAIGICAAKVSEAERLIEAGIDGVLITGPFASQERINKIVELLSRSPSLIITVDNDRTIENLDRALDRKGLSIGVLLDIDVGLKRTGIKPSEAMRLAERILSKKSLKLRGIQAYAGHLQHIASFNERKNASFKCFEAVIPLFKKLKSEIDGFTILSASGTGTFEIDGDIPEITEHQVGSYVCMDAEYLAVESSEGNKRFTSLEPALRLLTTVVSANQQGFVTADAGLKTIYKDGAVPKIITPGFTDMKYDWFGDEYGKIIYSKDDTPPALGSVLELIVSHCDPTVNLFDSFYITRGEEVVDEWRIDLRGCSQ